MTLAQNHQRQLSGNKFLILLAFLMMSISLFAQETYDIEEKGGVKYYVYIVQQGNTMYGIKTLFKIEESDLFGANPGLSSELNIGQKILVPVNKSGYKQASTENPSNQTKHLVEKGETLYGLSRKYNVSIEEIKKANPELGELEIGSELLIPSKGGESIQKDPVENTNQNLTTNQQTNEIATHTYEWNDSIVKHKVLAHETLYSISKRYMVNLDTLKMVNNLTSNTLSEGQEIIIPLKSVKVRAIVDKGIPPIENDTIADEATEFKDVYTITLLLPLFLDQNASHLASSSNSQNELLSKTKTAMDFYMGFLVAVDSLKKAGVNLNVQVLDTRGDSATVVKLLETKNVIESDLIIGPFYSKAIIPAANFALANQIHLVIPFSAGNKVLFNNPYVSKFVTSNLVLLEGTLEYIKEKYQGKNIVLIKSTSQKDDHYYEQTRKYLDENKIPYSEKALSTTDMGSYFRRNQVNVVLAPSSDRIFVSNLYVGLNKTMNKYGYRDSTAIHLFGKDDWERFDGIKVKYKTRMNVHYAAPVYVDWSSPKVIQVASNYRKKFSTDPSLYSLHGFDLTMFYMSSLKLFGTGFSRHFNETDTKPIVDRIEIVQVGKNHGFENTKYFIVRYHENYTMSIAR